MLASEQAGRLWGLPEDMGNLPPKNFVLVGCRLETGWTCPQHCIELAPMVTIS